MRRFAKAVGDPSQVPLDLADDAVADSPALLLDLQEPRADEFPETGALNHLNRQRCVASAATLTQASTPRGANR